MTNEPMNQQSDPQTRVPTAEQPIMIEAIALGAYQTNCYIIRSFDPSAENQQSCWIADCGSNPAQLLDRVEALDLTPEAFVLTHAHLDHIDGLFEAKKRFPSTPIWIHKDEELWLTDPERNLSSLSGNPVTAPPADRLINDNETLTLGGQAWKVMHTPGHSPGSISLYHEGVSVCIVGDALFNGSIGRTDFPGSSFDTLAEAIRTRLYTLPDETICLPGHGPATQIGHEKASNPFVKA